MKKHYINGAISFKERRNSKMELGKTYFWTNTVKNWKNQFIKDKYKNLIITTLYELVQNNLVTVYAFVIMPNHFHLIWKINAMNGKEMPHASLNKNITSNYQRFEIKSSTSFTLFSSS